MGWLSNQFGVGSGDPSNPDRGSVQQAGSNLSQVGNDAANFYGQTGQNYQANQAGLNQSIQNLQGLASGQNSVSAMQLQQGLQQQLAQQQAMAAGASPMNQAMAARNAAMGMGHAGTAMAGQQALAGLQERNQAMQQLGQLQLGQSGQNLQGTLGGLNAATGGYGGSAQAYGAALNKPQQTWGGYIAGAAGGLAAAYAKK